MFAAAEHLAGRCAGGDRFTGSAAPADLGFDPAFAQRGLQCARVVAAVGPQLLGLDATRAESVNERQQVATFVLVAGREPDLERQPGGVDG